jgi:hypothetical protein
VRIGSISQGKVKCGRCQQTIAYAQRYLIVREKGGVENEEGEPKILCVKCATEKKYIQTRVEKGEKIITFFQEAEKGKFLTASAGATEAEETEEKTAAVKEPEEAEGEAEDEEEGA